MFYYVKELRQDFIFDVLFFCLQISDIVHGQEPNVTAREALLRWARRSTARYPGVRVTDFTGSWRDGLAFSALLHRNRPDLVDWRTARSSQPRERLDRVFYVAEREYGVTRLLDPEGNDRLSCLIGYFREIVARHSPVNLKRRKKLVGISLIILIAFHFGLLVASSR